jgi:hypothetical protein
MSPTKLSPKELLQKLLVLHDAGEHPDRKFMEAQFEGFQYLWSQGLSCWSVTKMAAGNVVPRHRYTGVLTPEGIRRAKTGWPSS